MNLFRPFARLIERPPLIYRLCFRNALFRVSAGSRDLKKVYLTFDDGPIPEVTPWVLDTLNNYGVKATFFMVGDNVRRHPHLLEEVKRGGHRVGNHTMHHLQGSKVTTRSYMRDVAEADSLIGSDLFRPPHGWLRPAQAAALRRKFRLVMYDLVSRDYSRHLSPEDVLQNVRQLARPGAIIVFHDSLKAFPRLKTALPAAIEWLNSEGYEFDIL